MAEEKFEGEQLDDGELENIVGGRRTKMSEQQIKPVGSLEGDTPTVPSSPFSGSATPLPNEPFGTKP